MSTNGVRFVDATITNRKKKATNVYVPSGIWLDRIVCRQLQEFADGQQSDRCGHDRQDVDGRLQYQQQNQRNQNDGGRDALDHWEGVKLRL